MSSEPGSRAYQCLHIWYDAAELRTCDLLMSPQPTQILHTIKISYLITAKFLYFPKFYKGFLTKTTRYTSTLDMDLFKKNCENDCEIKIVFWIKLMQPAATYCSTLCPAAAVLLPSPDLLLGWSISAPSRNPAINRLSSACINNTLNHRGVTCLQRAAQTIWKRWRQKKKAGR